MDIEFSEFQYANGLLALPFRESQRSGVINFDLPLDWTLNYDLVALALTTLLGNKYSSVHLESAVSEETRITAERLTQATWNAPELSNRHTSGTGVRTNLALNFSGGFDSLAAQALLPRETHLISLNFGGPFAREHEFFKDFPTYTITTNFRDLGFSLNTWSFMGIGSILLRDYLNLGMYSFGAILEASPWHFNAATKSGDLKQGWFNAAGLKVFNPVIGMTEVGTAMIILRHRPELAMRSLSSVAAAGSLKHLRKLLLLHAARDITDVHIDLEPVDTDQPPMGVFGRDLANDFLSLYLHKHGGSGHARLLVGDLPQSVVQAIRPLSLDFYRKINTNFYSGTPATLTAHALYEATYSHCHPYTYTDWQEFLAVKEILARYHSFPA
ncbi:hypothetical protein OG312_00375 [Kocuria rhizophila]|uniref:hypothetical protein n=1 Tax=Kocuria rhizophila TaxID=72000 RepID=UPI000F51E378|nr:hypothetical protein [Kocuria rhizophila]MXN61682.1 hypothetical protein [Bacillus sp. BGMRC0062]WSQ05171.1 hypothetical protein OG312_00375 [Kocuria rhizophila]